MARRDHLGRRLDVRVLELRHGLLFGEPLLALLHVLELQLVGRGVDARVLARVLQDLGDLAVVQLVLCLVRALHRVVARTLLPG